MKKRLTSYLLIGITSVLLVTAQSTFAASSATTSAVLQTVPLVTAPIISTALSLLDKPQCAPGPFTSTAFIQTLCTKGSATAIDTSTQNWTWICSNRPAKDVHCSATVEVDKNKTQMLNGVTLNFQGTYTITDTTADVPVRISVLQDNNVNLSVYLAPVGTSFSVGQSLINQIIKPNAPVNTKISFIGLIAGKTYYFSIKNNITGVYSDPIQFTTTGGKNNNGGSIGVVGDNLQNGIPDASPAVTDTISDKGIVPKCGRTATDETGRMCTFKDFMQLIANVIQFGLIMIGPIVAILAMYAGAMIIWLGKIPDPTAEQSQRLRDAKKVLVRAAIGLVIIVTAWTMISTILIELGVQKGYILLDIFSSH